MQVIKDEKVFMVFEIGEGYLIGRRGVLYNKIAKLWKKAIIFMFTFLPLMMPWNNVNSNESSLNNQALSPRQVKLKQMRTQNEVLIWLASNFMRHGEEWSNYLETYFDISTSNSRQPTLKSTYSEQLVEEVNKLEDIYLFENELLLTRFASIVYSRSAMSEVKEMLWLSNIPTERKILSSWEEAKANRNWLTVNDISLFESIVSTAVETLKTLEEHEAHDK